MNIHTIIYSKYRADALHTPSRLRAGYPTLLKWRGRYDFSRLKTIPWLPHVRVGNRVFDHSLDAVLAHLSRRLRDELIVYRSSRRASVRLFTLSNMNISETNGSVATKFYLKHYWGGGKAVLGFGPNQIRTKVI